MKKAIKPNENLYAVVGVNPEGAEDVLCSSGKGGLIPWIWVDQSDPTVPEIVLDRAQRQAKSANKSYEVICFGPKGREHVEWLKYGPMRGSEMALSEEAHVFLSQDEGCEDVLVLGMAEDQMLTLFTLGEHKEVDLLSMTILAALACKELDHDILHVKFGPKGRELVRTFEGKK